MTTELDSTQGAKQDANPMEQLGPHERILQAALELFVKRGYFNTNVPDISRKSQCSVGSIYHHFLNKEEIARKLYDRGIDLFREAIHQHIRDEDSLETTVKKIVIGFMEFAETHKEYSRYLWLARHVEFLSQKITVPTSVGFDTLGRQLTKTLKNGIRSGEIPDTKAEIVWSIIFGMPISFIRDWLDGYTRQSPTEVSAVIAERCWIALKG